MMRRVRMASLLVALLLASAAKVQAECAWVLWQLDQTPIEGRPDRIRHEWHPAGATLTEARCDEWLKRWDTENKVKDRIFRCLPDTVDPRGPKGGGR